MTRIAVIRIIDGRIWIDLHWKTSDTGYISPPYQCIDLDEIIDMREKK